MKLRPCPNCGQKLVKMTTEMCATCRKKHRVSDVEMHKAAELQPWLSRAWNRKKQNEQGHKNRA